MISHRAAVVAGDTQITGIVGKDIVVLPDMNPKHELYLMNARAAVAEVGGPLAHLAIVSREKGRTLMRMKNACTLLKPGARVTLSPIDCAIYVWEERDKNRTL